MLSIVQTSRADTFPQRPGKAERNTHPDTLLYTSGTLPLAATGFRGTVFKLFSLFLKKEDFHNGFHQYNSMHAVHHRHDVCVRLNEQHQTAKSQ